MTHHYEGLLGNCRLRIGAIDVRHPRVETAGTVVTRILASTRLAPEQMVVTCSRGFNHLPRTTAMAKMMAMTEAKRILGG